MTNDITTLNGSLRELGELMATNLTTQGVASTYDEGLTTLANKILDIQGGGTTQTLTLTADKPILSYYNSDTATLTATLTGGSVSGKTVEFFNGATSLGTATTDNTGVATKIYDSTGVGDMSITAQVGSLTSETCEIEDCIYYSTTETECSSSTDSYLTIADLSDMTLPSKFELSMDYKTTGEARYGLFNKTTFTGNPNYSVFIGSPNGTKWYYGYRTTSTSTTDVSGSPTDYNTYTISRNGNTFAYKRDGSSTYTKSITWFDSYNYVIGIMRWTGSSSVKNIKLKAV